MSQISEKIEEALFTGLAALTAAPIAWPNIRYIPVAGTSFVEVYSHHKPAIRLTAGINPWMEYRGVLRLHVVVPAHTGSAPAAAIRDAIHTIFAPDTNFSASGVSVAILSCAPDTDFTQKTWTVYPLEVRWVCRAQG